MKWSSGCISATLLVLCVAAHAQQPIIIKFSHAVSADTPKGKAAERFKQLAEQRANGRVKVLMRTT